MTSPVEKLDLPCSSCKTVVASLTSGHLSIFFSFFKSPFCCVRLMLDTAMSARNCRIYCDVSVFCVRFLVAPTTPFGKVLCQVSEQHTMTTMSMEWHPIKAH